MPREITLYDAYGRPVEKNALTREHAAPSLAGIRTVWTDSVASGLTPARLASLLRRADEGDAHDYLTLAEEMEEREPHYMSVLGTRKRAVKRLPVVVESASDSADDEKRAEAVRMLVKRPGFKGMVEDALDALGKGYSVIEIDWDRSASQWYPRSYTWRDPRFFQFDQVTRSELRLRDEADLLNGVPLAPYKFIVHLPKLKSGLPLRGGIARLVAWSYMGKMYTFKDWLAFIDVFGMPLRLGRYSASATDADIAILKTAVANLGSDAAAVLPETMKIEFVEALKSSGGDKLFQSAAEWIDKQTSKAVLGQTMTADDGSSMAQAKVHDEVRDDIRDADAEQLEETLNRDLIRPFIDLNFGPPADGNYPTLKFFITEEEDVAALTAALEKLVPLGLEVEQSVIQDKLGLPTDIPAGAKILGRPAVPAAQGAANREAVARNTEESFPDQDLVDLFAGSFTAEELHGLIEDLLQPVFRMFQETGDLSAAMEQLGTIFPQMDLGKLQDMLGRMIFVAETWGRLNGRD